MQYKKTPYNTFGNPAVSGLMDQGERVPSKTMPDAFNGLKTRYKLISTQQDCSDCPIGRTATRRDASDSQWQFLVPLQMILNDLKEPETSTQVDSGPFGSCWLNAPPTPAG